MGWRVRATLCPARVLKLLVALALLQATLSAAGHFLEIFTGHDYVFGLRPLLDMNRERNIPTWYSCFLMIGAGLLAASIGLGHVKVKRDPQVYWFLLALLLAAMSYDEIFELHERFANVAVQREDHIDILRLSWALPGLGFAALIFLSAIGFLRRLEREIRHLVLLSGGVFVIGAIGFELLEEIRGLAVVGPRRLDPLFVIVMTLQETLELLGISLFIYALLRHVEKTFGLVTIGVATTSPVSAAEIEARSHFAD